MKRLDQIRAQNAIGARPSLEGAAPPDGLADRLEGWPMLLLQSGLLAALAFAQERRPNNEGWAHPVDHAVAQAVTAHLRAKGVEITQAHNPGGLLAELSSAADDRKLRLATAEAIRFLAYLKRFVG